MIDDRICYLPVGTSVFNPTFKVSASESRMGVGCGVGGVRLESRWNSLFLFSSKQQRFVS
jgi:hypothetical protein